jgi:hypothetical protein
MPNSEVGMPFCVQSQNHDRYLKNMQVLLDESFRKMENNKIGNPVIHFGWLNLVI